MNKIKILIAEDDFGFRGHLMDLLAKNNFDVAAVDDGSMVMERVLYHRPELIVLDLLLPKMDGFEVLKRIRTFPEHKVAATPVIVLSNLAGRDDLEKIKEWNVQEYLVKAHTSHDAVVEKIKQAMFNKSLEPEDFKIV